jgi:toxin ParE1/3/4
MRLVINDRALADIDNIYKWIEADSPSAAARVIERLFLSIETLLIFPGMGHAGTNNGCLEWAIPRTSYVVVYEVRVSSDELLVLGVFHQAQDRSGAR